MSISQAQMSYSGWSRPRNQDLFGESQTKILLSCLFHLHVLVTDVFYSLPIRFWCAEQSS